MQINKQGVYYTIVLWADSLDANSMCIDCHWIQTTCPKIDYHSIRYISFAFLVKPIWNIASFDLNVTSLMKWLLVDTLKKFRRIQLKSVSVNSLGLLIVKIWNSQYLKMASGETSRWSYECLPLLGIFLCVKNPKTSWPLVKLSQSFSDMFHNSFTLHKIVKIFH